MQAELLFSCWNSSERFTPLVPIYRTGYNRNGTSIGDHHEAERPSSRWTYEISRGSVAFPREIQGETHYTGL